MQKPNIVVILTDDQGYGDLGCMGAHDLRTPNIDALAQGGCLFHSMYSNSPVCSPSRAALLTGRYPGNAGVRAILAGHRRASGLTPAVPTIATALRREGYQTGIVGKWHLGLKDECRPNANGFDEFTGFLAGCVDYYSHIFYWGLADGHSEPTHDLWENDREIYANGEYMTDYITRRAVDYIYRHAGAPFFLYVAYNAPHYPMHAPREYIARFPNLPPDRRIMAAMLSAVDDGVGAIRSQLERSGILGNTIVYYQSDNGPSRESRNWLDGKEDPYYGGTTGIFTGHKYSLFEGGIRVPALVSWPGRIPAGRVIEEPYAAMDLFPTLLHAAGGDPGGYELNGIDILPVLMNTGYAWHDELFWEMDEQTAIRRGEFKLVLNGQLIEGEAPRAKLFLSNLKNDPGEKHNLANEMPDLANDMLNAAVDWREALERRWRAEYVRNYILT